MKQKKITARSRHAAKNRKAQPLPPVPDLMNNVTMRELSSGGWARKRGKKDPYKHVRPHPNAVAIRKLRAELAALGMPHSHPREYFGAKDAYWDFQNCIEHGLNPYDFDRWELERLKSEASERHVAEEKARWERDAEELRRNPPPPLPPLPAYRAVGVKRVIGNDAAERAPKLALHARYGKNWRPPPDDSIPVLERYWIDPKTHKQISNAEDSDKPDLRRLQEEKI
jgi:hypothetical protein